MSWREGLEVGCVANWGLKFFGFGSFAIENGMR